jgi:hypothetical protein
MLHASKIPPVNFYPLLPNADITFFSEKTSRSNEMDDL